VPDLDILNWTTASKTTDQKLLFVLTLWIHLRIDWINFGKTRKLFLIGKQILLPGVEVKLVLF